MPLIYKLLLISVAISSALACRCRPPNSKESYCGSSFTGVVQVISGPTMCDYNNCFEVNLVTTFKGLDNQAINQIKTATSSASCGRRYKPGFEYLVIGNPTADGVITTTSCGYGLNWSRLSEEERQTKTAEFEAMSC